MKRCELCKGRAQLHCASDQASLCWACDAKVHSANFLVARHLRNLLCHACQTPMPWSTSGVKLKLTISVCEQCVVGRRNARESSEEEVETEEDEQEEMVEENQAAPWSPPPPEEESTSIGDVEEMISRKRIRIESASSSPDLQLEVKSCASSQVIVTAESLCKRRTMWPRKIQRKEPGRVEECGSAILNSLRRLHREETGPGGEMVEICSLSGPSI